MEGSSSAGALKIKKENQTRDLVSLCSLGVTERRRKRDFLLTTDADCRESINFMIV